MDAEPDAEPLAEVPEERVVVPVLRVEVPDRVPDRVVAPPVLVAAAALPISRQ